MATQATGSSAGDWQAEYANSVGRLYWYASSGRQIRPSGGQPPAGNRRKLLQRTNFTAMTAVWAIELLLW